MNGVFDFLSMGSNLESRKLDRYKTKDLIIDTCSVTDSANPYETGVSHKAYNDGKWVIVEEYATREEAQAGHKRWVFKMTAKSLPDELKDVGQCNFKKAWEMEDRKFKKQSNKIKE